MSCWPSRWRTGKKIISHISLAISRVVMLARCLAVLAKLLTRFWLLRFPLPVPDPSACQLNHSICNACRRPWGGLAAQYCFKFHMGQPVCLVRVFVFHPGWTFSLAILQPFFFFCLNYLRLKLHDKNQSLTAFNDNQKICSGNRLDSQQKW